MSTRTEARTHKKTWPLLRAVFSRTTFMLLFLAIQIYFLWAAFTFLNEKLAFGVFVALSAIEVLIILNQEGSTAFKIAWIVPITLFPVFGALFYLYLRLQTRVKRMRHHIDVEVTASEDCMRQSDAVNDRLWDEDRELQSIVHYLYETCGFPCYDGTDVQFFPTGQDFFPVFCEELRKAKSFIFMEFFIVAKGKIWDEILEILKEKAREGLVIKFMYDGTNSIKNLPFGYAKALQEYGIDAKVFSPVRPALSSYQNNRDHRKICVIDGTVAFTGGVNLADEYANLISRFGVWKDTGVMVKGNAVNSFTVLFLQMWNSTYREINIRETPLDYARFCKKAGDEEKKQTEQIEQIERTEETEQASPQQISKQETALAAMKKEAADGALEQGAEPEAADGALEQGAEPEAADNGAEPEQKGYVIPYGDNPLDNETLAENVYLSILNEARSYVHIMTPYLILDDQTMHALCFAAKRGVDVKILFPHIPDKPYAFWLGHAYYEELLKNGVRIFEYQPGFVHAKEFISDGKKAVIGTVNLDFRSLYLHFENAVYLYGCPAIAEMERDFERTLADCIEIDEAAYSKLPAPKIFFGKMLRVLAPLF